MLGDPALLVHVQMQAEQCVPGAGAAAVAARSGPTLRKVRRWLLGLLRVKVEAPLGEILDTAAVQMEVNEGQTVMLRGLLQRALRTLCFEGLAYTSFRAGRTWVISCSAGARVLSGGNS
jgi:hypothetical protein